MTNDLQTLPLIEEIVCIVCGPLVEQFKDTLSQQEYKLSQLCQKCQDGVFIDD